MAFKKIFISLILNIAVATTALFFMAAAYYDDCRLELHFHHFAGAQKLILDSATYSNALNQSYTISKLKYYISHIKLKRADGKEIATEEYFLLDEEEPLSKIIKLQHIAAGEYSEISFMIGVDSIHNVSGTQTGALDPSHAMFWAWNTGYIFLKLEGMAPQSKSPGHIFEYHIGGFTSPNNCIRYVRLPLENFMVSEHEKNILNIKTDAAEILQNPTALDFGVLSSVTDFHNATTVANNYADMFSVMNVVADRQKK